MCGFVMLYCICFFFKKKTAYEMRISDWSSDVCSSDLQRLRRKPADEPVAAEVRKHRTRIDDEPRRRDHRRPPRFGRVEFRAGVVVGDRRAVVVRSEERRVGQECVSTGRSRWWR